MRLICWVYKRYELLQETILWGLISLPYSMAALEPAWKKKLNKKQGITSTPTYGRAFGRALASFITSSVWNCYMLVWWTKKQQNLHDLIASTYVLKN